MNKARRRVAKRRRQADRRLENFMAARHMDRDERANTRGIVARFRPFLKGTTKDIARNVKTIMYGTRYGAGVQKLAQMVGVTV